MTAGEPPTAAGRGGLGRGLDALIPRSASGVQEIPLAQIVPNPAQPRQQFDASSLEELAHSIREHGVLQPVIVSRGADQYMLIAGERRWRAAKMAGLTTIPALVKGASPQSALELALVENLQRMDLTALEEAGAYRELIETFHLTQDQVAARVGRSRVSVTNRLRLLSLPEAVRQLLAEGALTEGHARALLGCADRLLMEALAQRVVARGLSVRETEELVRRMSEGKPAQARARAEPSAVEEELQRVLGTRVQLQRARRGGRVVIHYYDDDQLNGLLGRLLARDDP